MTMEKVTGIGGFFFRPREPIYPPIDPSRDPLGTTRKKRRGEQQYPEYCGSELPSVRGNHQACDDGTGQG